MDSTGWFKDSINDFDDSSDNGDDPWLMRDSNKRVGAAPPAAVVTTPSETIKPFVESTFKQMRSTEIQSVWCGVRNEMLQQLVEQEWLAIKHSLTQKCSSIIELQSGEDNDAARLDMRDNGYRLAIVEDDGTEQWVLDAPTSGAVRAVQDGEYEVALQKDVAAEGSHTTTAVDDAPPSSVQETRKKRVRAHEHARTTAADDDADARAEVVVGTAAEVDAARAVRLEAALKRMRKDGTVLDGAESRPVGDIKDDNSVDGTIDPHAPGRGVSIDETDYVRASDDKHDISLPRVNRLLSERLQAKISRDFTRADKVRDELRDIGVEVFDRDKFWRVVNAEKALSTVGGGGGGNDGDAPEKKEVPPSGALIVKFADGARFTKLFSQLLHQSAATSASTLSKEVKTMWDEAKFMAPMSWETMGKFRACQDWHAFGSESASA